MHFYQYCIYTVCCTSTQVLASAHLPISCPTALLSNVLYPFPPHPCILQHIPSRERHGYWLPTMGCGYGYLWVWVRVGTRIPIPTTHDPTHGLFDFITSTVLCVRRGWEWMWERKRMMEKGEREEGNDEKE